ncbi:hypothetical protein ACFWGA_04160, partial [Amycolatopsis lurida]
RPVRPRRERLLLDGKRERRWRDGPRPDGGRGLPIIRAFAPEASVTSTLTGTIVRLAWPCPSA